MDALLLTRGEKWIDDAVLYPDGNMFRLDDFLTVEPAFNWPDGVTRIEYIPGERLSYIRKGNQSGPDFPFEGTWDIGDKILSSQESYKAAIAALHPEPDPLPPAPDRNADLKAALDDVIADQNPTPKKIRDALAELRKVLSIAFLCFLWAAPSWGMQHWTQTIQDQNGRALKSARISVYNAGTTTLATIYSDNGVTLKANPFTTGIDGVADFYAANGRYDINIYRSGYPSAYFDSLKTAGIALYDSADATSGTIRGSVGAEIGIIPVSADTGGATLQPSTCKIISGELMCPTGISIFGINGQGLIDFMMGAAPSAPESGYGTLYFSAATGRMASIAFGGSAEDYLTTDDTQTISGKTISGVYNTIIIPGEQYWLRTATCHNTTPIPFFNIPPTNGATPFCLPGTNQFRASMRFADSATESFYGSFVLPPTYDGTGIGWVHRYAMDTATTGAVGICMRMVRVPAASNPDPAFAALGTGNCTSNTVPSTAGNNKVVVLGSQNCTSCVAGDLIMFVVTRDGNGSAVTDSATGNMDLLFTGPVYGQSH